jgi:ABC-2 type transport system permease protein
MRTIVHLIRKEFAQFRRDRSMLAIVLIAPLFQLIILGYAANMDVRNIPMLVVDMDDSHRSRELVDRFTNSGYYSVVGYVSSVGEIDEYIDNGNAGIALVIPRNFGNDLLAGKRPQLQLIVDGSETNSATTGMNFASMIVSRYSQDLLVERLEQSEQSPDRLKVSRVMPEVRVWYNPDLASRNFMIPGIVGMLLMVITINLTSLSIVKEKEIGTYEQLIVTPIKSYQLLAGKTVPFIIIGMADVILVISIAYLLFGIPVKGSVLLLLFLSMIFLLTTLGLGLFVSTISRTQQQAMMTSVFFVMLPMIFLSGFVFPIENMPRTFQTISYFLPLRYFFVIVRGIFLKGVGLAELWDQAVLLTLFGVAIFTMSAVRFRKKVG